MNLEGYLKRSSRKKPFRTEVKTYTKRSFSSADLISYLQEKQFRSTRDLVNGRQNDEPTVYDYQKCFGSWSKAQKYIFAKSPMDTEVYLNVDAEYFVRLVNDYSLWTRDKYKKARKSRPDIIPSMHQLIKYWHSFSNLKNFCRAYSLKYTAMKFISLMYKLNKIPTIKECENTSLNIERLIKKFKSKKNLNDFARLFRHYRPNRH